MRVLSNTVVLPESMKKIEGVQLVHNGLDEAIPRLVVYLDSSQCSSCRIESLNEYDVMTLDYLERGLLDVLIIIDASPDEYSNIEHLVKLRHLHFDVYVDVCHDFKRSNPFIPRDTRFHSLLLDGNNKPILVGDPTKGVRIEHLFKDYFDTKQ